MTEAVIFGGTTEGRRLAERLAGKGIPVLVSVATEYGSQVMEECAGVTVHVGRLDCDGICALLREENPRIVVDATHPHATEVTRLVKEACDRMKLPCIRVVRDMPQNSGKEKEDEPGDRLVFTADTVQQAAEFLKADDRPILLTTGSKELAWFAAVPELHGRIYARVLPDSRVLAECEGLGIRGRHLIAMQGPFSEQMNVALLKSVGAGWLVTKESGSRGGYEEKLAAAKRCGVTSVVIRRPNEETGMGLEEAALYLEQELKKSRDTAGTTKQEMRQLSLIGMGMGMGTQLTQEAVRAIKESDAVLGAARMLSDVREWTKGKTTASVYLGKDILSWIQTHPQYKTIAVVYSGDTGFHSGASSLLRMIPENAGFRVRVYPGISTVSCLCARFQISWENLGLFSMHGQDQDVVRLLRENQRVFLLLGGTVSVADVCRRLTDAGYGKTRVYAGSRLGYAEERLEAGRAKALVQTDMDGLAAVILEREEERL